MARIFLLQCASLRKTIFFAIVVGCVLQGIVWGQRQIKRHKRVTPPEFKAGQFEGIFFDDALAQLQGDRPNLADATKMKSTTRSQGESSTSVAVEESTTTGAEGSIWKSIISGESIEDLIKESKSKLDKVVTTPAKFAGGGFGEARKEFTLIATLMAIVARYPEDIRWKNSAEYIQRVFARTASNCKVGTQPVFNEAKQRHQDLQDLLKGTKVSGNADEVTWEDIADRGPTMQILEWALRENLAPNVNNEKQFKQSQADIIRYAELVAAYGTVLHQSGMTDADDETYVELSKSMVAAAIEVRRTAKSDDAEGARVAVGKVDQSCNKCHESYR
jgi:hypothetical protein